MMMIENPAGIASLDLRSFQKINNPKTMKEHRKGKVNLTDNCKVIIKPGDYCEIIAIDKTKLWSK
ncbi:MAG: hypothetical protein QQN41_09770 [Nitrosopumilus sp.]